MCKVLPSRYNTLRLSKDCIPSHQTSPGSPAIRMSLAAQATLFLGILNFLAAVPQQGRPVLIGLQNAQQRIENIRENVRQQQFLGSTSSQPFIASGPQVLFGDEQSGIDVNRRFPVASTIANNLINKPNSLSGRNSVISAQQTQMGWSTVTNACIIQNDHWSLDIPLTFNDCTLQCQPQNGCRSVEYNTQNGKCILSKATSSSPNFKQQCPINGNTWIFTELIEIPTQNEIQNQPSRPDTTQDRFQQVGLSPSPQNDFHQGNQAPSLVQTARPSPTNTNQQAGQTTQQSGSSVSQNGRPQAPQNGANEGNAATTLPQHFQPATQHATHSPNTQVGTTVKPSRFPSSQEGKPQSQQSGFNPVNIPQQNQQNTPASSQHNNQAQVAGAGSPISSGNSQEKPKQCQRIPSPGECRGAFPRFFYNSTMDQCDCFLYGGCGNEALDSSWLTLTECTDTCSPRNKQGGPRCRLLPKQDIQTFTQPSTIIQTPDTSNISDDQLIAGLLAQSNQQQNQQNN